MRRNTSLSFTKDAGKSLVSINEALDALRREDRPHWGDALRFAPDASRTRVTKFQPCLPDQLARDLMVDKIVDLGSARRVLGLNPEVARSEAAAAAAVPRHPIVWVRDVESLRRLAAGWADATFVALDVETTLEDQRLCLIQVGTADTNYLIDPFAIDDLSSLAAVLQSPAVAKVIHNAQFEESVLAVRGIRIENVEDTMLLSRKRHGQLAGGHSLVAVVRRELDMVVDKRLQTSDWTSRPLAAEQEAYAALDVELLVLLRAVLGSMRR